MYSFSTTYIFPLLSGLYRSFLRPRANLKTRYGTATWAVVTGASEGIGQAMALELAKAGFNIVLIARNTQKLELVAAEIHNKYFRDAKVVTFDFLKVYSQAGVKDLYSALDSLDIEVSLLVNNVGLFAMTDMATAKDELLLDLIDININSMIFMTKYYTPKFLVRYKQSGQRSAIVNYSSSYAIHPSGGCSIYNGTKAFARLFSQSLKIDYES